MDNGTVGGNGLASSSTAEDLEGPSMGFASGAGCFVPASFRACVELQWLSFKTAFPVCQQLIQLILWGYIAARRGLLLLLGHGTPEHVC